MNQETAIDSATKRHKRLKKVVEKHTITMRQHPIMQVKSLLGIRHKYILGFVLLVPFCGYSNPGI